MNRPKIVLCPNLHVFLFKIAKAHHETERSVAIRTVIRVHTIYAGFYEYPGGQLTLNFEQLILEPATFSRTGISLMIELEDNTKFFMVKITGSCWIAKNKFDE